MRRVTDEETLFQLDIRALPRSTITVRLSCVCLSPSKSEETTLARPA